MGSTGGAPNPNGDVAAAGQNPGHLLEAGGPPSTCKIQAWVNISGIFPPFNPQNEGRMPVGLCFKPKRCVLLEFRRRGAGFAAHLLVCGVKA